MRRIPTALAQVLLALGSFALLRGSTCVVVYCSETCDPCLTQCKCHTCQGQHAQAYGPAHQLVAFELSEQLDAQGMKRQTLAWIGGLSVVNATNRTDVTARDFREFAEGVLGVNHELLDLEPALVTFTRVEAAGGAGEGTLEFVFDARGGLHEIVRALPRS
jgi:hypothetical protein